MQITRKYNTPGTLYAYRFSRDGTALMFEASAEATEPDYSATLVLQPGRYLVEFLPSDYSLEDVHASEQDVDE